MKVTRLIALYHHMYSFFELINFEFHFGWVISRISIIKVVIPKWLSKFAIFGYKLLAIGMILDLITKLVILKVGTDNLGDQLELALTGCGMKPQLHDAYGNRLIGSNSMSGSGYSGAGIESEYLKSSANFGSKGAFGTHSGYSPGNPFSQRAVLNNLGGWFAAPAAIFEMVFGFWLIFVCRGFDKGDSVQLNRNYSGRADSNIVAGRVEAGTNNTVDDINRRLDDARAASGGSNNDINNANVNDNNGNVNDNNAIEGSNNGTYHRLENGENKSQNEPGNSNNADIDTVADVISRNINSGNTVTPENPNDELRRPLNST
jgi:hypothetical protein